MLITVTFLDGQFGFLPDAPRASVSIGGAASGTVNQLYPITDKTTLLSTFSGGQLVEDRAFQLANGTGTAYAMRDRGQFERRTQTEALARLLDTITATREARR